MQALKGDFGRAIEIIILIVKNGFGIIKLTSIYWLKFCVYDILIQRLGHEKDHLHFQMYLLILPFFYHIISHVW